MILFLGTDNHMMLIDLNKRSGKEAENALVKQR
jgi:glycine/serine hydroxymethyltransferase